MNFNFFHKKVSLVFLFAGISILAGCENPLGTAEIPPANFHPGNSGSSTKKTATKLKLSSGNAQSAMISSTLSTAVEVQVVDQNGDAYAGGIPITFVVLTGGGSVSVSSATTDGSGKASTSWTLGSTIGTQTMEARASGLEGSPSTISFTATGTVGSTSASDSTIELYPASLVADGATTSSVTVTLKDSTGNLISGKTVTLSSSRGATDTVATVSGTTNASGQATFTVKSSTTGVGVLTATNTSESVTLSRTGKVLFLSATPLTDYRALNWNGGSQSGSNTSSVKDTWKDLISSATTNDGDLTPSGASNFAFTTSSGWGGDGSTTTTSGSDGPYRLIFDGTNDWVSFGTGVNTNNDFSFETWVYPSASGGSAKVILSNAATTNSGLSNEANTGITLKQSAVQPGKVEVHLGEKSYADEVLADSPLGYWRLGETEGLTAYDSSGNGRHGAYLNGVTLGQTGPIGDSDKAAGFTFANSNSGKRVSWNDLPVFDLTGQFTLEGWFYSTQTGNDGGIIGKSGLAIGYSGYLLWINTTDQVVLYFNSGSRATSAAFSLNTWHHAVGTWDGTVPKIYVDGVAVTGANYTTNPSSAGMPLLIGAYDNWNFGGYLDEVAIYTTALTSTRVLAHYYAGLKRLSCASTTLLANSSWYHIAAVFNSAGPTLKMLINGSQECTATLAGAAYTGSANDLRAGRDQSATNSWNGGISDIRTWNSVLSNTNVATNFSATSGNFPSFTPSNISGLKLWLKADTGLFQDSAGTTAVSADSDPVGKWTDQSGVGNHFTQTVAGSMPAYRTSVINSLPVVRFDGTDDKLTGNAFSTMLTASTYTIFTVAKAITAAANGTTPQGSRPLISCTGPFFSLSVDATGPTMLIHGNDGSYDYTTQSIATGTFYLITGRHENGYLYLHKNGGAPTSTASGNAGMTTLTIQMGANYDNSRFFNGDIAEMLIYNTALSDSDRKRVEAYLNVRFNVY